MKLGNPTSQIYSTLNGERCQMGISEDLFYTSPEQLEGSSPDRRSDIWQLGCIMYELCSLRKPFDREGQSIVGLINDIKSELPPIPERHGQNTRNLIEAMLKQKPEERPKISTILKYPKLAPYVQTLIFNKIYQNEF